MTGYHTAILSHLSNTGTVRKTGSIIRFNVYTPRGRRLIGEYVIDTELYSVRFEAK